MNGVSLQMKPAKVQGDRVQLVQVMVNRSSTPPKQ
jgi:hypothetical protein